MLKTISVSPYLRRPSQPWLRRHGRSAEGGRPLGEMVFGLLLITFDGATDTTLYIPTAMDGERHNKSRHAQSLRGNGGRATAQYLAIKLHRRHVQNCPQGRIHRVDAKPLLHLCVFLSSSMTARGIWHHPTSVYSHCSVIFRDDGA